MPDFKFHGWLYHAFIRGNDLTIYIHIYVNVTSHETRVLNAETEHTIYQDKSSGGHTPDFIHIYIINQHNNYIHYRYIYTLPILSHFIYLFSLHPLSSIQVQQQWLCITGPGYTHYIQCYHYNVCFIFLTHGLKDS